MNEHLARWTVASIVDYFKTIALGLSLPLFVEGLDERISSVMEADRAELRVNGPFVREVSKDCWRLHVDINILVIDHMQVRLENAYSSVIWGGKFLSAMTERIPVYRYGTGIADTSTLVGCLTQQAGIGEPARLINYGQVNADIRIRQSAVVGQFEMFVSL